MFSKPKIYLILGFIFLIFIFLLVLVLSGGNNITEPTQSPSAIPIFSPGRSLPSPGTFRPSEVKPILTNEVPRIPDSEGGGVNLESPLVQDSQKEIAKILPFLPYQNTITTSSEKAVSILIPSAQFQTVPWVLDLQISGINYHATETDEDYLLNRDSFKTGAANIFEWLNFQGANPEKIIINWGDRAYIRESAEKWLSQ